MKRRRLAAAMGIVLTLTTLLGCAPTSSAGGETQAPKTDTGQTEQTAEAKSETKSEEKTDSESSKSEEGEKIELTMWDLRTEGAAAKMMDTVIADFMKENPNISIKRSAFKVADLRNTIKPAINSGEGPDVFSYDAGAGYLGVLAKAGLALDMTPYEEELMLVYKCGHEKLNNL